jgi:hypothetical protein
MSMNFFLDIGKELGNSAVGSKKSTPSHSAIIKNFLAVVEVHVCKEGFMYPGGHELLLLSLGDHVD